MLNSNKYYVKNLFGGNLYHKASMLVLLIEFCTLFNILKHLDYFVFSGIIYLNHYKKLKKLHFYKIII